jgi:polar amino acid transport system permease protein
MQAWSWSGFWSYFVNPYLLGGAGVTLALTVATLVLGLIYAFMLVIFRLSGNRLLEGYARFHVWLFRGTPLLVQLIIIYTGLPQLGLIRLNVIQAALLGLVLNEAAYLSEILRAGIQSVGQGQRDAAMSLGLNRWKTFVLIIMPQAMRVIVPALGNSVNGLLKTTSIASVISMEELLRRGQILMQQRFEVLEVFVCIAIIYLFMTTCWEMIQRKIEAHYAKAYAAVAVDTRKDLSRDDR